MKKKNDSFIFDVSIDRLTIVGDLDYSGVGRRDKNSLLDWSSPLQVLLDTEECISVMSSFGKTLKFRVFDKVYVELNTSRTLIGKRAFRMDFNPNNLGEKEEEFLKEKLLCYVKNADFTRVDIAFDCEKDLSEFVYIEKDPKKRSPIFGRGGKLETLYLGTRHSSKQIRIYNKNQESRDKQMQVDGETGEIEGFKFVPPLDRNEQSHDDWWRFEFTLKRNEIDILGADKSQKTPFDGLQIVKPNYKKATKVNERAMLYYLQEHPEERGNLNPRTRKKYDDLMLGIADIIITEDFKSVYKQKRADIQYKLTQWKSATKKKIQIK